MSTARWHLQLMVIEMIVFRLIGQQEQNKQGDWYLRQSVNIVKRYKQCRQTYRYCSEEWQKIWLLPTLSNSQQDNTSTCSSRQDSMNSEKRTSFEFLRHMRDDNNERAAIHWYFKKARQYVANRTRGKTRKYVDGWARMEANNKQETTIETIKGRQYVDTWRKTRKGNTWWSWYN